MVRSDAIKKIKAFIEMLISNGIPVEQAFLYGSFARNEANELSDIDVLLVSDKIRERNLKIVGKIYRLAYSVDYRIEPFLVSKKKFLKDQTSVIIDAVRKEGIEIKA